MNKSIHTVQLQSLTMGSVMNLLFIANIMLWGSIGIILGLAALFGFEAVKWNEEVVTGFGGLILGLSIAAIFGFIATAITGLLTWLGIRLYSALRPDANLSFLDEDG